MLKKLDIRQTGEKFNVDVRLTFTSQQLIVFVTILLAILVVQYGLSNQRNLTI